MIKYVEVLRTLIIEIVTTHVETVYGSNSILWDDEKAPLTSHHENVFVIPKIALAHRRKKSFIHDAASHYFFFFKDLW